MATVRSGNVYTSTYNGLGLLFSWSIYQQTIDDNGKAYSQIRWTLRATGSPQGASYYKAGNFSVVVQNQGFSGEGFSETLYQTGQNDRIDLYSNTQVATGYCSIPHLTTTGAAQLHITVNGAIYSYAQNVTGSGSFDLAIINPRAYPIIPNNTMTVGEMVTIALGNYKQGNSYTLTYTNVSGSIPVQTIATKTLASTILYTPPETLYQYMTSAVTYTVNVTCETFSSDGTSMGKYVLPGVVLQVNPEFNLPSITDIAISINSQDTVTQTLTGAADKYILNYTLVDYAVTSSGSTGATIEATNITNAGQICYGPTGTFPKPITQSYFVATVTDSRGLQNIQRKDVTAVEYVPLTMNAELSEPSDNSIKLRVSGNYWTGNFGAVDNELTLTYRRYEENVYNGNITITPTIDTTNHTYSAEVTIPIGTVYTYYIQVFAEDKCNSLETEKMPAIIEPIFDWSATDFNINVPVTMQESLDVKGVIMNDGEVAKLPIVGEWTPNLCLSDGSGSIYLGSPTAEGIFVRIGDYCIISWFITGLYTPSSGSPTTLTKICIRGLPYTPDGTRWWAGGGNASGFNISTAGMAFSGWCLENVSTSSDERWGICGRTVAIRPADETGTSPKNSAYIGMNSNNPVYSSGTIMYRVATTT